MVDMCKSSDNIANNIYDVGIQIIDIPPHNNWAVDMIESLLRKGAVSADCDCKK